MSGSPFAGGAPSNGGQHNPQNNPTLPHGVYSSSPMIQGQSGVTGQQMSQLQADFEQELYLRRQIELQRDIELRRRLIDEQHQQLLSELSSQQQTQQVQQVYVQQQLTQSPIASSILQQQRVLDLQQLVSPGGTNALLSQFALSNDDLLGQVLRQELRQAQPPPQEEKVAQQQQTQTQALSTAQSSLDQKLAQAQQSIQHEYQADLSGLQISDVGTASSPLPAPPGTEKMASLMHEANAKRAPSTSPIRVVKAAEPSSPVAKSPKTPSKKRKGLDAVHVAESSLKKKPRTIDTGDSGDKEDRGSTISTPASNSKDIAMLLRATGDPAVKDFEHYRRELADDAAKGLALAREAGSRNEVQVNHGGVSETDFATKSPDKLKEMESPGSFKRYIPPRALPALPVEPDYIGSDDGKHSPSSLPPRTPTDKETTFATHIEKDGSSNRSESNTAPSNNQSKPSVKDSTKRPVLLEPLLLSVEEEKARPVIYSSSAVDTWWPANAAVRKERKCHNRDEEEDKADPEKEGLVKVSTSTIKAIRSRLENDIEPGVLQKLPHCKLHRFEIRKEPKRGHVRHSDPMFCFQVTESHCTNVMLCCSICSTWRHAQCGGHHTKYAPKHGADKPFRPICDRCYEDSTIIKDFPVAQDRIARQRNEHLRRSLASASVMRQACVSKHSGQYRWPLGHVAPTHIDAHMRSVQIRHERAERQWRDAVSKLGAGASSRKKEHANIRTKELERMLGFVEDAEAVTDLHNMTMFLQRDSTRETPAGFEKPCCNFFDPETPSFEDAADNFPKEDGAEEMEVAVPAVSICDDDDSNETDSGTADEKNDDPIICARGGCEKECRFDSMFCSDACGVAVVEADLLKSFELASAFHPSVLTRNAQYT